MIWRQNVDKGYMNYDQIGKQHVSRRKPSPLRNARQSPSSFDTRFSQKVGPRPDRFGKIAGSHSGGFAGTTTDVETRKRRHPSTGKSGFSIPLSWVKNLFVVAGILVIGIVGTNWDNIAGGLYALGPSVNTLEDPANHRIMTANAELLSPRGYSLPLEMTESVSLAQKVVLLNVTKPFSWTEYTVERGDSISKIAANHSLNQGSLISLNKLKNAWDIKTGQELKIPNMDGITYVVQKNDSISKIAAKMKVPQNAILDANDVRNDTIIPGQELFIPGAIMDAKALSSAITRIEKTMIRPVNGRITSGYGWREDPVHPRPGEKRFHQALDFSGKIGDPVKAAMSGTVGYTANNPVLGNFIILKHGKYQTLYAHLSAFSVKTGEEVKQGQKIGEVGNTGYTTGPHLHFEVFQNGNRVNPLDVLR